MAAELRRGAKRQTPAEKVTPHGDNGHGDGSAAGELNFVSERTHSRLLTGLFDMFEGNSGDTLGRCSVPI